jgi:hypothetical protein
MVLRGNRSWFIAGQARTHFRFRLENFDWNCPQHITSRFTEEEVSKAVLPLRNRLAPLP